MPTSLSPELVLVLPESQRAAAIRALPMPEVWSPGPLGPPERVARNGGAIRVLARPRIWSPGPVAPSAQVARSGATSSLVANALLYFGAKLVWTIGAAALYVLAAVAIVVVLTLLF
jgi:hypothetical protein